MSPFTLTFWKKVFMYTLGAFASAFAGAQTVTAGLSLANFRTAGVAALVGAAASVVTLLGGNAVLKQLAALKALTERSGSSPSSQ